MCYSAPVSFILSGVLTVVGALTIASVKNKSHLMFASIPLLFAVQQAAEGVVWLACCQPQYGCYTGQATYVFLFFAFVIWPCWMPLSLWMMEKNPMSKKILKALCVLGAMYGAYTTIMMMLYNVHADVAGHSIRYNIVGYNGFLWILDFLMYQIPTVLPFFVSRVPGVWIIGSAVTGSLIFTYYFMQATLVSVWCFFAAAISMMILWVVRNIKNTD